MTTVSKAQGQLDLTGNMLRELERINAQMGMISKTSGPGIGAAFAGIKAAAIGAFGVAGVLGLTQQAHAAFVSINQEMRSTNRLLDTLSRYSSNGIGAMGRARQEVSALMQATGMDDAELFAALDNLITLTKDVDGSMRNLSLVVDIAADRGMDLKSAAQAVAFAMEGSAAKVGRLIPEMAELNTTLDDTKFSAEAAENILGKLEDRFSGRAGANAMGTDVAKGGFQEMRDQMLLLVVDANNADAAMRKLGETMYWIANGLEEMRAGFSNGFWTGMGMVGGPGQADRIQAVIDYATALDYSNLVGKAGGLVRNAGKGSQENPFVIVIPPVTADRVPTKPGKDLPLAQTLYPGESWDNIWGQLGAAKPDQSRRAGPFVGPPTMIEQLDMIPGKFDDINAHWRETLQKMHEDVQAMSFSKIMEAELGQPAGFIFGALEAASEKSYQAIAMAATGSSKAQLRALAQTAKYEAMYYALKAAAAVGEAWFSPAQAPAKLKAAGEFARSAAGLGMLAGILGAAAGGGSGGGSRSGARGAERGAPIPGGGVGRDGVRILDNSVSGGGSISININASGAYVGTGGLREMARREIVPEVERALRSGAIRADGVVRVGSAA